ncbi:MAG: sigma-54 dependent transcriptional regulator [Hydrogenophaga sp.]|nr:sigma-54 dependent transcriptional regulator [Gammaproteobacteria bacterium]
MQTVLVVEDDRGLAEALADTLDVAGFRACVAHNAADALATLDDATPDLVVSDVHMPGMDGHALLGALKHRDPELPVLLMTAYASVPKAVEAMRAGAVDYLVKPFEAAALVEAVNKHVRPPDAALGAPLVEDPRSRELFNLAGRVAHSDVTVLIHGESGSGKEVIARYVHEHSARAVGPFVAVNCAAIPENMLEATLFGWEKGAYTGAVRSMPGKFEQAQGGTLLLDEVSEMDPNLQAKLLRVLQEREVERLGGERVIPLDVRVLATTNRDLREEVHQGRFREDLYFRLAVFPLRALALRERPGDILPLAERSLAATARAAGRKAPTLSPEAAGLLRRYGFPGNVRELDNLMQRALILQPGDVIGPADLVFEQPPTPAVENPAADGLNGELKEREYHLITEALRAGSRKMAAQKLGISERTLRYKLARMREEGFACPERLAP